MTKIDARLTATRSADGLQATLQVGAGEAASPSVPELIAWLASQGVRFGLDTTGLELVVRELARFDFEATLTVAHGTPPEAGRDGHFAWLVPVDGTACGRERADGSIDHRARDRPCAVDEGLALAEIADATPGRPGMSVAGQAIAATPGRPALAARLGSGVSRKGEVLVAARTGVVFYRAGELLDVVDHLLHQGDVGMDSGNLDAPGAMTITGNVEAESRVSCKADMRIDGYVEGATVRSGGMLLVKGGLLGQGVGHVYAAGDIQAKHADQVQVLCRGTLTLERSAIHTHAAAKAIVVGDGRGKWLGGEAAAEDYIIVGESGSRSHHTTLLAAAQPLELATRPPPLPSPKRSRGHTRPGRTRRASAKERTAKLAALQQIRSRQAALATRAKIEVRGMVQPGTTIMIGSERLEIEKTMSRVRFRYDAEQDCIMTESL